MPEPTTEPLRVRDPISGHEYTPTLSQFAASGLSDDDVIDKPALAPSGDRAPVLYRTAKGTPRTGSKAARRRTKSAAAADESGTTEPPAAQAEDPSGPDVADPTEEEN